MFWNITALSSSSPVDSLLDKENFTLEELLDEEEIIQECKSLNNRLINFLRDGAQVEQLLRYIIEEPLEDADNKRTFKFPFIACEVFTCEIDVILKTLVDEEELMDMLFSFLEPNRPHSALLAGYFSKVVICLMLRKTVPLVNYVQSHQDVFRHMVDLIGIISITEVLLRLVGADYHHYPNSMDVMQWLADSDLLEMIVDKLNPSNPSEVHANAAETLCAITRNAPSPLATKLSSPSFVARIFNHALEDSQSKSALIHSLSVCISMLDPKRSSPPLMYSIRNQHVFESPTHVNPETVGAMLLRLADLLMLLSLSVDEKILPTTYGELKPPLGKYRLKIVEFIAVLLKCGNKVAEEELVSSGTIKRILDLFFEYPYNNALHHHVESIVYSCLDSKKLIIVEHLFKDCKLADKILQADRVPTISGDYSHPTIPSSGRQPPRAGYIGHITRMSNKIVQLGDTDSYIQVHLQETPEWNNWQSTILQQRNAVENVYRWACGRPTALQDRTRDSDEDDVHDHDYDVAALANNLSQAFRYTIYDNDDIEEGNGALDRDDEDNYFDDESAEVVISSLRLSDEQGRYTNSNWFAVQKDAAGDGPVSSSENSLMEEINLNGTSGGGNSSSDDEEMVVGDDKELTPSGSSGNGTMNPSIAGENGFGGEISLEGDLNSQNQKNNASGNMDTFRFEASKEDPDLFGDRSTAPDWVAWGEDSKIQLDSSSFNPFLDQNDSNTHLNSVVEPVANAPSSVPSGSSSSSDCTSTSNVSSTNSSSDPVPSLFEEDVEFVGVEIEGTEKAMEQALKEGIVGEAGPLKRNLVPEKPEKEISDDDGSGVKEFNDANYWRVDQGVAVLE